MRTISTLLFDSLRLISQANYSISRSIFGWIFAHMSFIMPAKRVYETEHLIAFHHPKPSHTIHILLAPKKAISGLEALSPEQDQEFLLELFATVQKLVIQLGLESRGYRLIINGGKYQDIPQMHFHLIADEA